MSERPDNASARSQAGISLVEIMIAMVLGVVLTAAIIQVFVGNRTTYAFTEALSRVQEHGRFALDHVGYAARMAGYVGCLSSIPVHNRLAAPNLFRDDVRDGLRGYEYRGTGPEDVYSATAVDPAPAASVNEWDPPLPSELSGLVVPGSDVLVVRGLSGASTPLVAPFSNSAQLFVAQPQPFLTGQLLVVTDCQKASLFQLTNISNASAAIANLVHGNPGGFTPGNASPLLGQSYGLGSEVAALEAAAFYVGVGHAGGPALFQLRLQRIDASTSAFVPEELVEGIDTLQLRYGLDTDNDGRVDTWSVAGAGIDWDAVLAVEIALLARAPQQYGGELDTRAYALGGTRFDPVDDRRMRQVFSTTVGIRNRLP